MIYVDEEQCTGCALCVDACAQQAICIKGAVASIDQARCTACGRCVDVCLPGAIISLETISELPSPSLGIAVQQSGQPHRPVAAPSLSPGAVDVAAAAVTSPVSRPEPASKFDSWARVLSGLLNVAVAALERRQARPAGSNRLRVLAGGSSTAAAGQGGARLRGRQTRRGRQGRGYGAGLGSGQGRSGRSCSRRQGRGI